MRARFTFTAIVLAVVVTLTGCPSTNPSTSPVDNENNDVAASANDNTNSAPVDTRLQVTPALQQACPNDDAIDDLIVVIENGRLAGDPLPAAVAAYLSGCDLFVHGLGEPSCYQCGLAAFDQVRADDLPMVQTMPRPNLDGTWTLTLGSGAMACIEVAGGVIVAWDDGCAIAELDRNHENVIANLTKSYQDARDECVAHMESIGLSPLNCYQKYQQDLPDALADAQANHDAIEFSLLVTIASQPFIFSHGVIAWGFTTASSAGVGVHSLLIVAGINPPAGYFDGLPVALMP